MNAHEVAAPAICHPERSEGSLGAERRSFAALRMTAVLQFTPMVAIPTTVIGEQAFLLLAVLEKGHVPAQVTIPLELVIRASTTAAKDNHEGSESTCGTTS